MTGLYKVVVLHDDERKAGKLSANHNVEPLSNAILSISSHANSAILPAAAARNSCWSISATTPPEINEEAQV